MSCEIIKRIKEEIERDKELKTLKEFKNEVIKVMELSQFGALERTALALNALDNGKKRLG